MRRAAIAALALVLASGAEPARAFVPHQTRPADSSNTCPQRDRWITSSSTSPVIWQVNPNLGPKIHGSLAQVGDTLNTSFATWTSAPNTNLSSLRGADLILADPNATDGRNVISFIPTQSLPPGVLAVTFTTTSDVAGEEFPAGTGQHSQFVGQLLDADIIFNPSEHFAVPAALNSPDCLDASGNPICYDLQSLGTHEIGHLLGLSHTGVWGAMLWPFAPTQGTFTRDLSADDRAGIATLYPSSSFPFATGKISGRVLNAFGQRTFGAHVVAVSTTNGATVVSTIATGLCINNQMIYDGSYLLEGLDPGSYQVFAEPLDGPTTQSEYTGFFGGFNSPPTVDTGFTTRAH